MRGQKKKQSGITLIALVISIIVMLILAGVSLNAMIGENGIISQAQNAKLASEEARWYEEAQMILASCYSGEEQICRLSEEEEFSCAGDVTKIEELRNQKIITYLRSEFEEISDGEAVMVSVYGDGYLIVVGKRALIVDSTYAIVNLGENNYLVATGDEWRFTVNGTGTAKLVAYNLEPSGVINIPTIVTNKEDGTAYVVTEIGNSIFNLATKITKVNFNGTSLKKIDAQAFKGCKELEITLPNDLPNSLTELGDEAFSGCKKLNGNINSIQSAIETLGKGVFSGCPNLSGEMQAVFEQSFYEQEDGTFSATEVAEGQFSGFEGLTGGLEIPYYITKINNNAFSGCTGITALTFEDTVEKPSQLTSIGNNAFYRCSGIANGLALPNQVVEVGAYSFYNCNSITSLTLSSSLKRIGGHSFENFNGLSSTGGKLIIPKSVIWIGTEAFAISTFREVVFESGRTSDLEFDSSGLAFWSCGNYLTKVTFAEGMTTTGMRTFDSCNIGEIYLPNSLEIIDAGAFRWSTNLNILSWGESLTSIYSNAFYKTGITTLPNLDTLTYVGDSAFSECTNLNSMDIINWLENSKITNIGANCFENDSTLTGGFSGAVKNKHDINGAGKGDPITIGASAFLNTNVTRIANLDDISGIIAKDSFNGATKLEKTINGIKTEVTEITASDLEGVTSIGENAFAGCVSLTKITIPSSVTNIGDSVFKSCTGLTTVVFETGSSITSISNSAFYGCSALNSINLPPTVTTILGNAFNGASSLTSIVFPNNVSLGNSAFSNTGLTTLDLSNVKSCGQSVFCKIKIKELTIPDSWTSVPYNCFSDCKSLERVYLGKNVNTIREWGFDGCSKLVEVTFSCDSNITLYKCAFQNCGKLATLNGFWNKVISIQRKAFGQCYELGGEHVISSGCYIDDTAFDSCKSDLDIHQ